MNDRRNRAPVKGRLVEHAEAIGPVDLGVTGRDAEVIPVSYDMPPDEATESCFYFTNADSVLEGETGPTSISYNDFDDDFDVQGTVDVFGFDSCSAAEEAVERALVAFEKRLAQCKRLRHPDDDPITDPPAWDVEKASVTAAALRSGHDVGDTWAARYSFTVRCVSNIRYPTN